MISNKCQYALKAMLELAKREGSGPATIQDIAQAQHIPPRFLEAILRQLRQSGLTESVRGKKGGYVLARPARSVTLGEVIRMMDGPYFQADTPNEEAAESEDVFSPIWKRAEAALDGVYNDVHFKQLAEADRARALQFVANYSI